MRKTRFIYFASSNKDKLREIKSIWPIKSIAIKPAPKGFQVVEDGKTFIENAYKKAHALSKQVNAIAFADDSGIEVFALNKKPGIRSSRYFRGGKGLKDIVKKIKNKKNRKCFS